MYGLRPSPKIIHIFTISLIFVEETKLQLMHLSQVPIRLYCESRNVALQLFYDYSKIQKCSSTPTKILRHSSPAAARFSESAALTSRWPTELQNKTYFKQILSRWLSSSGRWRRVALIRTDVSHPARLAQFHMSRCIYKSLPLRSVFARNRTP
jgi:hypothetical protein